MHVRASFFGFEFLPPRPDLVSLSGSGDSAESTTGALRLGVEVKASGASRQTPRLKCFTGARRSAAVAVLRCDRDPFRQASECGEAGPKRRAGRQRASRRRPHGATPRFDAMACRSWLRYSFHRRRTDYPTPCRPRRASRRPSRRARHVRSQLDDPGAHRGGSSSCVPGMARGSTRADPGAPRGGPSRRART